ncbi:MAG: FAD/FMN-containing dehydrogenase [Gammaproteobacteria bacterium]|jgi:FAD/FMN-containing dehydrogenase
MTNEALIQKLISIVGDAHVIAGDADKSAWETDPSGKYSGDALAVVQPANTHEVSAIVRLANETNTPVVPQGGNTGLAGGCYSPARDGGIILSLARMNKIREIRTESRLAIVEAGVILETLHNAADNVGLVFPLRFGARGSCMIGGNLSTNAGGSNVVRYGNTRDLVLGLEAVLPDGSIVDLMSELHKDNTGYSLKHLLIGAEGTLGVITTAVLKLFPKPKAYATALISVPRLGAALEVLNRVQAATSAGVEAFEYLPRGYFQAARLKFPLMRMLLDPPAEHAIFLEIGAISDADATPDQKGNVPIVEKFNDVLGELIDKGLVLDGVLAKSEAERKQMWEQREVAYEVSLSKGVPVATDVAVSLDRIEPFLQDVEARVNAEFPQAEMIAIAHLGDGNLHNSIWLDPVNKGAGTPQDRDRVTEIVEEVVSDFNGSFSAEHGIGVAKLNSMARQKDQNALSAMRAIKSALDPNGIMNPGKVLPPAPDC